MTPVSGMARLLSSGGSQTPSSITAERAHTTPYARSSLRDEKRKATGAPPVTDTVPVVGAGSGDRAEIEDGGGGTSVAQSRETLTFSMRTNWTNRRRVWSLRAIRGGKSSATNSTAPAGF